MTQELFELNESLDNKFSLNNEELEQIVKAILVGKYSWACVLILHFAGYNPLDYIPYRTYIRLLKNNCQLGKVNHHQTDNRNLELVGLELTWIRLGKGKYSSN